MFNDVNDFLEKVYGISFYDENNESIDHENCHIKIDWASVIFIAVIIIFTVILSLILSII